MWNTSELLLPYALVLVVQCHHSEMWHRRKKNLSGIFFNLWSCSTHNDSLLTKSMLPVTLSQCTIYTISKKKTPKNSETVTLKLYPWNSNNLTAIYLVHQITICHIWPSYCCIKLVPHWSQTRPQAQKENKQQHIFAGWLFMTIEREHVHLLKPFLSVCI